MGLCFCYFERFGMFCWVWNTWFCRFGFVDLACFSLIEVLFIFKAVFIFEFVFIFQAIFIFKIVFLSKVVFQFEVFIIFNVIFIFEVISIYVWIFPATTKISPLFKNCYISIHFHFLSCEKNFLKFFMHIIWVCRESNFIFESKKQFENWPLAANLGLGWALQYP